MQLYMKVRLCRFVRHNHADWATKREIIRAVVQGIEIGPTKRKSRLSFAYPPKRAEEL